MSNLDVPGFRKFLNIPPHYDLLMKMMEIMNKDRQLFEHETYEEDTRPEKRMKLN